MPILSMDTRCPECAAGASGLIGHKYIVVDRSAAAPHTNGLRFRCSLCGLVWRRLHARGSLFVWHRDDMTEAADAAASR